MSVDRAARAVGLVIVALVASVLVAQVARPRAPAEAAAADELPRRGSHLGVRIAAVPVDVQARARLRANEGVMVDVVAPDTAAERGGLRRGDVLLTLDGRQILNVAGFSQTIGAMRAGQRVTFGVWRDGGRLAVPVTLGVRPPDRGAAFDVLYRHVRSNGARIRTIVTRPHASGQHPAVVLIQGLGAASIDEPLAGPSGYSQILSAFADAGWVTVRIEKPGIGDSEGTPYADIDFTGELDVYRQALRAVTTTDFVDRSSVFVFGHSIGGVFAPLLAREIPVRGVAVYGTVVKPWIEYAIENTRRQNALAGTSTAPNMESVIVALGLVMQDLFVDGKTIEEVARTRPHTRNVLARFFPDGRYFGRTPRFWAQLQGTDLAAAWAKVSGDVLVLWGRNDFVASEDDHRKIAALVQKARPGKATYLALDGVDHVFRRTTSMQDSFRRWNVPGGEVNPEVITVLTSWMEKVRHGE